MNSRKYRIEVKSNFETIIEAMKGVRKYLILLIKFIVIGVLILGVKYYGILG